MKQKKNIIFLYSEVVGYLMPLFRSLSQDHGYIVSVVHWDKNLLKPYTPPEIENVTYYPSSSFSKESLNEFCLKINPEIIYVSGWMDKTYLSAAKIQRKRGIKIITGFDDMWKGNSRQLLGSIIFKLIGKKYFSHAWVAGPQQYEFARRLGFKTSEIVFDLLSANSSKFNTIDRPNRLPKKFLYVGNFREVKGTDILAKAFKIYKDKYKGDWELICVGNGEMQHLIEGIDGVNVFPYASEDTLMELASDSSVMVLPSRNDQWGVVVHEFSAVGMALLLSENVGAKSTFFINKFNGLSYSNNSAEKLAEKMDDFSKMEEKDIRNMQINSIKLSTRITTETSVANFLSII